MPDFFRDKQGRVRVVRSSPGYEYGFEGLREADKDYLRRQNGNKGYTHTADRQSRAERIRIAADSTALHSGFPMTLRAKQAMEDKLNAPKRRSGGIY